MASNSRGNSKSKQKKGKSNAADSYNIELVGFIMFCIGVLLMISMCFTDVLGTFGECVSIGITYMFGSFIGVVFCAYVIIAALLIMIPTLRPLYYKKWVWVTLMVFIFSALTSAICFSSSLFKQSCNNSWVNWIFISPLTFMNDGINGGGLIGNGLSFLLIKLMSRTGAIIVLSMLMVIDLAVILGQLFFRATRACFCGIGHGVKKVSQGVGNFAGNVKQDMDDEREQVENGTYVPRTHNKDADAQLKRPSWMKGKEKKATTFDLIPVDEEDVTTSNDIQPAIASSEASVTSGLKLGFEQSSDDEFANDGFARSIRMANSFDDRNEEENIQPPVAPITAGEQISLAAERKNAVDDNTVESDDESTADDAAASEIGAQIKKGKAKRIRANYKLPSLELLDVPKEKKIDMAAERAVVQNESKKLEETLKSFGVDARVVNVTRGPAVTRYELHPGPGVKVSKVVNLADDIALSLASNGIRIEAPIPGKSAIGIEVPNKTIQPVSLREMVVCKEFKSHQSNVAFALGKSISGEAIVADIAKMPHLLIAGTTGSGKSVCMNSMIISFLYKSTPDQVKLVMIDPKRVELSSYDGIPHLLIPVVTDPKRAASALGEMVKEMTERYNLFAIKGVKDISGYNAMAKRDGFEPIPQYVIIIDELADLMMVSPKDVEDKICRLAQMARAAGMHLVIATQSPRVDVITGLIKSNIPSRIALSVASQIDSRTILDTGGAEKLLGNGDMLFHPVGKSKPLRVKGCFVSEEEVERIVHFVKEQQAAEYNQAIIENIMAAEEEQGAQKEVQTNATDGDELLSKAVDVVMSAGQASSSLLQRKLSVGYARAARIIDQMEERGIVGPPEGSKPRKVIISVDEWQEMQMGRIKKMNELNTSGDVIETKNLYNPLDLVDSSAVFDADVSEEDDVVFDDIDINDFNDFNDATENDDLENNDNDRVMF